MLTSCATIVSGTNQKVAITSLPERADIIVDGNFIGKTPCVATLSRSSDHYVTLQLDGYEPYNVHLSRHINGWTAGNLVNFTGIAGFAVDALTGSMFKLSPNQLHACLSQDGVTELVCDDVEIAVVNQADPSWEKVDTLARQ